MNVRRGLWALGAFWGLGALAWWNPMWGGVVLGLLFALLLSGIVFLVMAEDCNDEWP